MMPLIWQIDDMSQMAEMYFRQGFPCLFHLITGFYCPGCGGTRAVKYLLQGQLGKSLLCHPLVVYTAAVGILLIGTHLLAGIFHRPKWRMEHYDRYVFLGIIIILLNWIGKNYLLLVCGIDLLTGM